LTKLHTPKQAIVENAYLTLINATYEEKRRFSTAHLNRSSNRVQPNKAN